MLNPLASCGLVTNDRGCVIGLNTKKPFADMGNICVHTLHIQISLYCLDLYIHVK